MLVCPRLPALPSNGRRVGFWAEKKGGKQERQREEHTIRTQEMQKEETQKAGEQREKVRRRFDPRLSSLLRWWSSASLSSSQHWFVLAPSFPMERSVGRWNVGVFGDGPGTVQVKDEKKTRKKVLNREEKWRHRETTRNSKKRKMDHVSFGLLVLKIFVIFFFLILSFCFFLFLVLRFEFPVLLFFFSDRIVFWYFGSYPYFDILV